VNEPTINATAASLLGFLHCYGPNTGWDLVQAIEGSVGYFWNVTRSQVYRELKTLAEAGLVSVGEAGPRDRLPYALTPAGKRAFLAWLARTPGEELLRMPMVVTVFFGRDLDPALLRRHLQEARLSHQKRLAEYQRIAPDVVEPFQRAALDLGLAYEQTVLGWLDGLPWIKDGPVSPPAAPPAAPPPPPPPPGGPPRSKPVEASPPRPAPKKRKPR
jgi:DNA-binding PadR family transcriptional regulator